MQSKKYWTLYGRYSEDRWEAEIAGEKYDESNGYFKDIGIVNERVT